MARYDVDGARDAPPVTVTNLVRAVTETLSSTFRSVYVEGELSNVSRPASGHVYFSLKDERAQIRCVLWRSGAARLRFVPEDGQLVRARGGVGVYAPRGDMQLVVERLELAGEGALQQAFEALKRRLAAEGLFEPSRKRALPRFPRRIGVVTSGTGAALRDILTVLQRRYALAHVIVVPVRVQGDGASTEIAGAVGALNALPADDPRRPDVLIVGRGGGSLEDLWAFNEEGTARAVYASAIPVVSAVGHETDVSICDLTADVRAATPSAAAELVVPDRQDLLLGLRAATDRNADRLTRRLQDHRTTLHRLMTSRGLSVPEDRVGQAAQRLDAALERFMRGAAARGSQARMRLDGIGHRLRALDPERPLSAGFVLVRREGAIVRRADALVSGDRIRLAFRDGDRGAVVD